MMIKQAETEKNTAQRVLYWLGFVALLASYLLIARYTNLVGRSQEMLMIGDHPTPVSAFAGVVASVANICVISMVIFYGKTGFYTTLLIFLIRFIKLLLGVIFEHSITSIPGTATSVVLIITLVLIYNRNRRIEHLKDVEIDHLKSQHVIQKRFFEQVSKTLVSAIDEKDRYTNGHSLRVAEYSEKIARLMGKDEDECYRIYYVALLHDVGKIGIDDGIIRKNDRLTDEEYDDIKQHPVKGKHILSSVNEYPYLSIGAKYHHERYDGKGYPEGLKGKEIPEIARIIAVADAYDAMTSDRSYRTAMPQQMVREEIVRNSGTQFDPEIAEKMLYLIDHDTDFRMREKPLPEV